MRVFIFLSIAIVSLLQLFDSSIVRNLTSMRDMVMVDVKDGSLNWVVLETQEIVNNESIENFAVNAVLKIFNFRPGQTDLLVDDEEIKALFVNEMFYESFREQFLSWGNYEFRVNNVAKKETVATYGKMTKSPTSSEGGARLWRYTANMPVLDRGVGATQLTNLSVVIDIVYLGPSGGTGIYAVKLSN